MEVEPRLQSAHEMESESGFKEVRNIEKEFDVDVDGSSDAQREALMKRVILSLTKPSYVLGCGSKMVRAENRVRLRTLLSKLLKQQNWTEASGVLSMLLKATLKENSPMKNRLKYLVSMELLKHIEGDNINSNRIKHIYDTWMRKIGSMKYWPLEDRFAVHVEFIMFCLTEGNVEDANQAALWLMQAHDFESDPMSNMIVGLTFRQLWYSSIPMEMQCKGSDQFVDINTQQSNKLLRNSEWGSVGDSHGPSKTYPGNSESSVMNDKLVSDEANISLHRENSLEAADIMQEETHLQNFEPEAFYLNSASTGKEGSFNGDVQYASAFSSLEGLDALMLPLRLPHSIENWEDVINVHGDLLNDHYKNAVKHLHLALHSSSPILAALFPLIQIVFNNLSITKRQLLLIGGQFDKVMHELEEFCNDANTTLPVRLRAMLVEHFDRNNNAMLASCIEQIIKKDPTCGHSLGKLLIIYENGCYSPESLLEMIALHLDATYGEYNIWRQFALCFLKLSQYEEDRISTCSVRNDGGYGQKLAVHFNKNLKFLTEGKYRKSWRLRCRWWRSRHFSYKMLASEISAGILEILTYKAACASHIYGRNFEYVVKTCTYLETQNNRDLIMFLQVHLQSSAGISSMF